MGNTAHDRKQARLVGNHHTTLIILGGWVLHLDEQCRGVRDSLVLIGQAHTAVFHREAEHVMDCRALIGRGLLLCLVLCGGGARAGGGLRCLAGVRMGEGAMLPGCVPGR